jgi:AcrR family transcriptional regulator
MGKASETRRSILQKAQELIYAGGYRSTSIDDIIATTQVTKGAFYYHFKNKEEMGVAIVNEILKPLLLIDLGKLLENSPNPLDAIYVLMSQLLLKTDALKAAYGCPAANLTQEMTPWNIPFSNALEGLTKELSDAITAIIEKGKTAGYVRSGVVSDQVTLFILSGYWGVRSMGKLGNSKTIYVQYLRELKQYLESLR